MEDCSNCNYSQIHSQNKYGIRMYNTKNNKKCNSCHDITLTKEHKHKIHSNDCYSHNNSHKRNSHSHEYDHNCNGCNSYNNYYSNKPRRRHRHNTTHDFTNTNGLVSDHCFCHKYKLTGHYHSRKCCYQDLKSYYSGIIEDESTKKCVPNKMCKYYNSYY